MSEHKISTKPQNNGRMGTGEKAKNFGASMKKLLSHIKPFRLLICIALIFAIAGTVFSIIGPSILEKMMKLLTGNPVPGTIKLAKVTKFGIFLVILYVTSAIFQYIQGFIFSKVSAKVSMNFRTVISEKINKLPLSYFDKHSYGDVLSRVTNDVDTIGQTLNNSLATLITSMMSIIGIPIMMFILSWQLALVALIEIPLSFGLILLIVKFSQKHFKKQQNSLGEINGHIEEIFSAHNVVKAFNGEEKALNEFKVINKELQKSAHKSQFISGLLQPIINFVGNLVYAVICVLGAYIAVKNKDLSFIATIISFITYIKLFNQPLAQLGTVSNTLQSTAAAAERVFEFLDEEEQIVETQGKEIENIQGQVEFKNVGFGYTKDKEIIHDFSFIAKPGQKIAIVGPTGAGKTTLVNLLMRFYEFEKGDILIDGVSIKEMKRGYVRSLFGMVLQDTWLFEGTIKDNVAYGRQNATEEEIINACKAANVDHFITTLPNGYDMILNEDCNISQGQKQLLTIARAMVQNSPMLILDEATSSVDTRTEILIQTAMDRLMQGRTSFVIAHRLSTIKNADQIIVVKDGNIVEFGNHETLLKKGGFYCELYNSQFEENRIEEE